MSFLSRIGIAHNLTRSTSTIRQHPIIQPYTTLPLLLPSYINHHTVLSLSQQQQHRFFGSQDVPVLPESIREPDNIYRRPQVLPFSSPLSIDSELIWNDPQSPEPTFDMFEDGPPATTALRHLIYAFMMLGGVFGIISLWRWEPHSPVIEQVWPYNNLRLELGGLNGAKSSEGKRENFFTPTPQEKKAQEGGDEE